MTKRFCKRPWGYWIALLNRKHFKVKLLRFKTGGKLSRQYHNHRHELWLFLSGWGFFSWGQKPHVTTCEPGYYREARITELHKFEAMQPTWVLEVQYGERCVEEDIVRV